MLLKLLVMVLKVVLTIGLSITVGTQIGVTKVSSRLNIILAVLMNSAMLVKHEKRIKF